MMLMKGPPAVTRMVRPGEEGFHNMAVSKEEGSLPCTYEIVMVSLGGSLLLLVAISVAISVLWRRCTSNYSTKDLSKSVVKSITVTNNSSDKISTVDLTGPVCVSYTSDTQTVPPEFVISEETISIFELPFFSFTVSITPPGSVPEQ